MFVPTSLFQGRRRFVAVAVCVGIVSAGAAGASTIHRMTVTQGGGSLGATAFVQGSSNSGALQGEVNTSANTGIGIPFGVLGEYDYPAGQFGVGVIGLSTTGYAIGAESFNANNATVLARNESGGDGTDSFATTGAGDGIYSEALGSGDGVDGVAQATGWGGYFQSTSGIAVEGYAEGTAANQSVAAVYGYQVGNGPAAYFESAEGNGIHAIVDATTGAGILGDDSIGSRGILGNSTGEAIAAFGHSGDAHAVIAAVDAVGGTRLFETQAYNGGTQHTSLFVDSGTQDRSGDATLSYSTDVQTSGDIFVYGEVFQNCKTFPVTSSVQCEPVTSGAESTSSTRSANGTNVAMFAARQSLPTVEDEGTAQLVNGRAYVRLDPAFAQTMATDRPYRVFVTPDGPSRGVYVTNRTQQGFEVDENPGGRSTLSFEYRIVGAPFGDRSARLAVVPKKINTPSSTGADPASLRVQAAEVRDAGLARNRAQSRAPFAKHRLRKVPPPLVNLAAIHAR